MLWVAAAFTALTLVVGASAWMALGLARNAMVGQVQQAEELSAQERADEAGALLARARAVLADFAGRPVVRTAIAAADTTVLQAEVDSMLGFQAVIGARLSGADGTVLVTARGKVLQGRTIGIDAAVPGGGLLHLDFAVPSLLPRVIAPLGDFHSTVSLVDRAGAVLATNSTAAASSGPAPTVRSPELLRLLGRGGVTRYHSQLLDQTRVAAVAVVPGTTWSVVVGAPAEVADLAAAELARQLDLVVGGAALAGGAILAALGVVLGRSRRRLVWHRQSAEALAMTDPVTGLGNRRRLDQAVEELAARGESASLALLDLDAFKVLNDQRGHVAGDEALRVVGQRLVAAVRSDDVVVRWGGDEFAVLLVGDAVTSMATVERLRSAVSAVEIPGFGPVRASLGLATGPADLDDLFRQADLAMYEAKRARARQ